MRANAAADVSARMRYLKADVNTAVRGVLDDIGALGGDGGIIAVDSAARFAPGTTRKA